MFTKIALALAIALGTAAATFAAPLLAGAGTAAAQVADDPPGSAFQNQGIREYQGQRATPSVFSRTAARARAAFAQAPGRQRVVRR